MSAVEDNEVTAVRQTMEMPAAGVDERALGQILLRQGKISPQQLPPWVA